MDERLKTKKVQWFLKIPKASSEPELLDILVLSEPGFILYTFCFSRSLEKALAAFLISQAQGILEQRVVKESYSTKEYPVWPLCEMRYFP